MFTDSRHWIVFDDTVPALERLRAAGWRHVVLSNHVKPHPAAFAAALETAAGPEHVWMVGDNPDADIAGADAAGIRGLLVRGEGGHDLAWAADRILRS